MVSRIALHSCATSRSGRAQGSSDGRSCYNVSPISTYCSQPGSQRASQRASQPASQRSPSSAILLASDPHSRPQRSSVILILRHSHPEASIASSSVTSIPQPSSTSAIRILILAAGRGCFQPCYVHHQESSSSAMPRRPPPALLKIPAPCKPRMR